MKSLVFVYNGDSGLINSVIHLLHKKFSPETYNCQLCAIIYDGAKQDKQWVEFAKSLPVAIKYHHRDTFIQEYGALSQELPVVFVQEGTELQVGISAQDFQSIKTMEQLKNRLTKISQ